MNELNPILNELAELRAKLDKMSPEERIAYGQLTRKASLAQQLKEAFAPEDRKQFIASGFLKLWELLHIFPALLGSREGVLLLGEPPGAFLTAIQRFLASQLPEAARDRPKPPPNSTPAVEPLFRFLAAGLNLLNEGYEGGVVERSVMLRTERWWSFGDSDEGDMRCPATREALIRRCREQWPDGLDLVTGDAAAGQREDFSGEEVELYELQLPEIIIAFCVLKAGGNFVLKFLGAVTSKPQGLILLLLATFERVTIVKPLASKG